MRIIVVGATGHVGSYLIPRLVRAGYDVVAASRGSREPYHPDPAWSDCERIVLDREATDADTTTAAQLLAHRPDVVVDMVCFTPESAAQLVDGLRGHGRPAGSLRHRLDARAEHDAADRRGRPASSPSATTASASTPIERLLLAETAAGGLASTVIHPGHISGPGWPVINPVGNLDPQVWATIAAGDELLPRRVTRRPPCTTCTPMTWPSCSSWPSSSRSIRSARPSTP